MASALVELFKILAPVLGDVVRNFMVLASERRLSQVIQGDAQAVQDRLTGALR